MDVIQIEDEPGTTLSREDFELRRRHRGQSKAVCHAPFVSLHLRESGEVTPCRHTALVLGHVGEATLEEIWTGHRAQEARRRFRDYRVRREECGACIARWEDGLFAQSPAIAEFDAFDLPEESSGSPQPRALSLEAALSSDGRLRDQLQGWLPGLSRLEILVRAEGQGRATAAFVEAVRLSSPATACPVAIHLIYKGCLPSAGDVPLGVTRIEIWPESRLLQRSGVASELRELASELRRRETAAGLHVLIDRESWIDLPAWLEVARASESELVPVPLEASVPGSLAALDGDTLAALHDAIYAWSESFGQGATFYPFLSQLRRWEERAPAESTAELLLPGLDHPSWTEESLAVPFLRAFLRIFHSPRVEAWFVELARDSRFVEKARGHLHFRLVSLWLAVVFGRSEQLEVLRRIYGDAQDASRIVAADRRRLEGTGWEGWFETWVSELRLEVARPRPPAFLPSGRVRGRSAAAPDVTVLIPSYNHAAYLGAAIESVLGQSHDALLLRVADDRSRDDSVQIARSYTDPRIAVTENPSHLGLTRGLARTLAEVDTPYVAILNSDDVFFPRRLESCLATLRGHPEAKLVATGLTPIDHQGGVCSFTDSSPVFDGIRIHDWLRWFDGLDREAIPPEQMVGRLLEQNFLVSSSNIVARTGFLRQGLATSHDLEYCLDWHLFLLAALEGSLGCDAEVLLAYRLHEHNTVWWGAEQEIRYYLERHTVFARMVRRVLQERSERGDLARNWADLAPHLARSLDLDWRGLAMALLREEHPPSSNDMATLRPALEAAVAARSAQLRSHEVSQLIGDDLATLWRQRGENAYLRSIRVAHEVLEDRFRSLQADFHALGQQAREQASRVRSIESRSAGLARELNEHREVFSSSAYRVGRRVVALLPAQGWLSRLCRGAMQAMHRLQITRLASERRVQAFMLGHRRHRALATVCCDFPIYSHTFVYQELQSLMEASFLTRLIYSRRAPADHLQNRFRPLWRARRRLWLENGAHEQDFRYFCDRLPAKVHALISRLSQEAGFPREKLLKHPNFLQSFSFARLVEAYRPHYLHSYFFYDRSLMALVASYLLDIPRGVSCYADHRLADYDLKLVRLHLELSDLVVATSERIRRELIELAPRVDPTKILVKPNAIDAEYFAGVERREPEAGEPYRLVCVSRIEPKKGLTFLVEAVHLLRREGHSVELHLVGEEDTAVAASRRYRQELCEVIDRHRLWGNVHLEGRQGGEGVKRFLGMAHLFVAPFVETEYGDKDGIPTSLLEAFATGLPAVATDAGSIRELVEDEIDGLIVPQRDVHALAGAIGTLLDDAPRRRRMGRRAAAKVRQRFDVRVCERSLHERVAALIRARQAQGNGRESALGSRAADGGRE